MTPYDFAGTERFEVRGRLGSGTSGEVYKVFDRKLGSTVALKTLFKSDPGAIFRFKKEFRALADVNHHNLVQLYELLSEGEHWFFTMELVDGLDFIDYARAAPAKDRYDTGRFYSLPTLSPPPDSGRLRASLRQLAEGLCALHHAGKLHCDIKPSNIRITPAGRVVLLDFGLVKEVYPSQIYETMDGGVAGTPAYMSPEQAAGRRVTAASDWYCVGVLLYEALIGRVPFSGGFLKILTDKQKNDPEPPHELVPEVPEDLSDLCMRLLDRQGDRRPSGERILRKLGGPSRPITRATHSSSSSLGAHFVGRVAHLAELGEGFARTREGKTVVFFVHGSSGVGKSALVRRFLQQVREEVAGAVLLTGRCYERESVPYKALDSLIDALSRYLRRLGDQEVELLLPTNVLALARLFPVLRRVQAIAGAQRRVLDIPDSREQRRRAFAAMRELLDRLTRHRPLLLFIDDLHWGDLDSAALLAEVLRPPQPPNLMLISCYRSEERDSSPFLESLLAADLDSQTTEIREIPLKDLSPSEAREMALGLLGESTDSAFALADTISRESDGSPFFIDELVRYSKASAGFDKAGDRSISSEVELALSQHMSLEKLIHARIDRLSPEARRLLEVVAVAGQPVDLEAARQAAELGKETQAAITILRGASLSRILGAREREEIETYHDRVRAAVMQGLGVVALKRLHRRLALALEGSGRADPETLAIHFNEAGETTRAAEFAAAAADQASEALAFDRAARLYRIALDLEVYRGQELRQLRIRLADALTNAGRGAEAADAYLDAAEGAKAAEALELRRRAAEQQLISGHIDQGLETIRTVLQSVGMKLPETPRRALLALLWQLLRLKLRGLRFKERDSSQIAPDQLIAIDTCWSVSIGLGTVDTIRGMGFGKRHLLLALEAGEPYRVARALAIEAGYASTAGHRNRARTARLIEAAVTLAERVNHPHALGLSNVTAGMAAYLEGSWRKACELLDRGEKILREHCTGVTWELDTAMSFQLRSLLFIGDFEQIRERLPRVLKDVREKGDLYAEVNLRCRFAWFSMLVADRPEDAQREADDAIGLWSRRGFHIQHYWHLTGVVEIALYRGDPVAAWESLERSWPAMKRSMLPRIQLTGTEARVLRGRAGLAAAIAHGTESPEGRKILREVETELRRVEREKLFYAQPLTQLVRAGIASAAGDDARAHDLLVAAAAGFEAADMDLHAAVSRWRRARVSGEGSRLIRDAERWLSDQGVVDAERLADVIAPGKWRTPAR
ncbi:MAG: AAA family ATPase [bacterium]|nr:AAA family ATPase [bacterium]